MAKKIQSEQIDKPITWKDIKDLIQKYSSEEYDFVIFCANSAAWQGIMDNLKSIGFVEINIVNNPTFERHPYLIIRYYKEFFAHHNYYSSSYKVYNSAEIWWLT
jgi:hypothetical protein